MGQEGEVRPRRKEKNKKCERGPAAHEKIEGEKYGLQVSAWSNFFSYKVAKHVYLVAKTLIFFC